MPINPERNLKNGNVDLNPPLFSSSPVPEFEIMTLLKARPGIDPSLLHWARRVGSGQVEGIIQWMIRERKAGSPQEAIARLEYEVRSSALFIEGIESIHPIDLKGGKLPFENVNSKGQVPEATSLNQARRQWQAIGTLSHLVVPAFLSGRPKETCQLALPGELGQLRVRRQKDIQLRLEENLPTFGVSLSPFNSRIRFDGSLEPSFQDEIISCCGKLSRFSQSPQEWLEGMGEAGTRKEFLWLWQAMIAVYGDGALKIYPFGEASLTSYYRTLTLLTWGLATAEREKWQGKAFLREINLDPYQAAIHGGRVDALIVDSLNGRSLTAGQKQAIESLPRILRRRGYHPNFPTIYETLLEMFPAGKLGLRFCDWKFAVGDNPTIDPLGAEEIINNLPPEVAEQMRRYSTMASLSFHWERGDELSPAIWGSPFSSRLSQANACFFFPSSDHPVVEYPLSFSAGDKQEYFAHFIAPRLNLAMQRRSLRITNRSVRIAEGKLNGRHPLFFPKEPKDPTDLGNGFGEQIRRLVESHTKYLDPAKLIRIDHRTDGRTGFVVNYPNLIRQIREGKVHLGSGGIRPTGFFVSCLNPDHPLSSDRPNRRDIHPSMMIYPQTRTAKCFACGFWARLEGVPPEIVREDLAAEREGSKRRIDRREVPVEHARLIQAAEGYLSSCFNRSRAEEYVVSRGIDPRLAIQRGVGFYDDRESLIASLREEGFSQQNFLKGGLLTEGAKGEMFETFRIRGGRITFPLSWMGSEASLYGRCLENLPKRFSHRKLTAAKTSFPQGVSRYEALFGQGQALILFEGVFDAMTADQLAKKLDWSIDNIALIGLGLHQFLEVLAQTQNRPIGLALDFDAPGQTAFDKLSQQLRQLGFKGEIFDFNEKYIFPLFPGARKWDDLNKWLKEDEEAAPFRYPNFRI